MPLTPRQQNRKDKLQAYKEGFLSEKTKKAFGFPLGPVQMDFDPLQETEEEAQLRQELEED